MSIAQRFFFGLMILTLFSMLLYLMPDGTTQARFGAWSILMQIAWVGFLLSRSKKE